MRHKYYEERFPEYTIKSPLKGVQDWTIWLGDGMYLTLPAEQAKKLVKDRWEIVQLLIELVYALEKENPELFKKIYYE